MTPKIYLADELYIFASNYKSSYLIFLFKNGKLQIQIV